MLNIHNLKHNKEAFTLVEVMLLLVVLSLVFASSVSLITRKHKLKPRRSVHGQYVCFREPETGVLRQVKYSGKSLLQDQREIDKCTFEAPSNSSYMYIMLVGAGGAGGNANHKSKTADLYEGPMYIDFLKHLTSGNVSTAAIEVPGLKAEDVTGAAALADSDEKVRRHSSTWVYNVKDKDGNIVDTKTVPFSVLAFKKILADNNIKIFAYDYAGDGDNGGEMQYGLFSRNDEDGDDKDNWYLSSCKLHGSSGSVESAKKCLQYLMVNHKDKIDVNKCVLRAPLSQNCPYLHEFMDPLIGKKQTINGVEQYDKVGCSGYSGQEGKLIFTKERPFDLKISYANGARYKSIAPDNKSATGVIDWGLSSLKSVEIHPNPCVVSVAPKGTRKYNNGTFMTYDEAVESLDLTKYNNGDALRAAAAYGYPANKDSSGFVQTEYDNGSAIYDPDYNRLLQRIFKTYPSVENLDYKIFTQWGKNRLMTCESQTGGIIKGEDGENGGLPFFPDGNEGVKICVGDNCYYEAFSSYKGGTTISTGGTGGKGREMSVDLDEQLDLKNFIYKKGQYAGCSYMYDPNKYKSLRTLWEFDHMGDKNGYPFFSCTGRVGFSYSNSSITGGNGDESSDYSYLLRINPNEDAFWHGLYKSLKDSKYDSMRNNTSVWSYRCPALETLSEISGDNYSRGSENMFRNHDNSIGLKISHYISRSVLHHGEHGSAGESKTLFARSFGAADITMLPGLEGKKKDIVTATDATDEDRAASAGNGQSSTFGIGCHTQEDGELKCDYKLVAKGGAGGAGFVEEDPAFTPESKAEIADYVKKIKNGTATAPDKYSASYEDGSYEGEDSDFQQIAYLSDFPGTDARDIIKKLGKGGDGGYVHHKCWLQPQYFKYHYKNWDFSYKGNYGAFGRDGYTFNDWIKDNNDNGVIIPNIDGGYNGDEFEGYTAFTEDIIKRIGVCGADGKEPQDQFDEIQGTDGYPGAIVIMW